MFDEPKVERRCIRDHLNMMGVLKVSIGDWDPRPIDNLERLLELRSAGEHGDPELGLLRKLLQTQVRKLARYRCERCGFRARDFHWQCPGCTNWDTYPPRRVEEVEAG